MKRMVYISDEEREKCRKVVDAFEELYEKTDDDILVLDAGTYGYIKLQYYNYPYGFNTFITFTDCKALFDDLWEDWLNMQLFELAMGTSMIELDYEDIFKCLPKETQDMLMEQQVHFAEKTGIADILG